MCSNRVDAKKERRAQGKIRRIYDYIFSEWVNNVIDRAYTLTLVSPYINIFFFSSNSTLLMIFFLSFHHRKREKNEIPDIKNINISAVFCWLNVKSALFFALDAGNFSSDKFDITQSVKRGWFTFFYCSVHIEKNIQFQIKFI